MKDNPFISIIIPVYNTPKELLSANINSILSQEGDIEIIYINDGSTVDYIDDMLSKAAFNDNRVKYIKKNNTGVSDTRNEGIRNAFGQYLMFVDADDTLTKNCIKRCCLSAQKSNADVIMFGITNFKKSSYEYTLIDSYEKEKLLLATLSYLTNEYIQRGISIDGPVSKLFRSSIIKQNKIFFPLFINRAEDAIFDAYFYEYADKILIDNFDVYNIVLNPNSITKAYKYSLVQMIPLYLQEEEKFIDEFHPNSDKFQKALSYRAYTGILETIYAYFEPNPERKKFSTLRKEYTELMKSPIVHKCLMSLNDQDLIIAGFKSSTDKRYLTAFQKGSFSRYIFNIKLMRFKEFILKCKLYRFVFRKYKAIKPLGLA